MCVFVSVCDSCESLQSVIFRRMDVVSSFTRTNRSVQNCVCKTKRLFSFRDYVTKFNTICIIINYCLYIVVTYPQVYPQIASASSATSTATTTTTSTATNVSQASSSSSTTRPTISLLPNVLTFRTHPILTTPTLNLAPPAVHPTATASIYNPSSRLYNPISNFPATNPALQCGLNITGAGPEALTPGRKMMRCQHCCIWFEDSALGLLHQSLHSADETDPFTCKKCLKRLGNRLEFTAHIIWHLDPTMEDSAAL